MKSLILLLTIFLCNSIFAQKGTQDYLFEQLRSPLRTSNLIDCSPILSNGCNLLANNDFVPNIMPYGLVSPFSNNVVSNWSNSYGSPQLHDQLNSPSIILPLPAPQSSVLPPPPATGYAFMYTAMPPPFFGTIYPPEGEGIIQKLPKLIPGHKYVLSFFRMVTRRPNDVGVVNSLNEFNIVLMQCSSQFFTFNPLTYIIPNEPVGSQKVYCENNLNNFMIWEKKVTKFTASSDFNMIWIYPKTTTVLPVAGINFAFPELIDVTNFNAGNNLIPDCNSANIQIGPVVPNCSVEGATYTWYGPGNTIVPVTALNQQITINPNAQFGNWTLKMEFPTSVFAFNNCSQAWGIESTINVAQPTPSAVIQNPTLTYRHVDATTGGYTDNYIQNLDQCNENKLCFSWNDEWFMNFNATSSSTSGNIWEMKVVEEPGYPIDPTIPKFQITSNGNWVTLIPNVFTQYSASSNGYVEFLYIPPGVYNLEFRLTNNALNYQKTIKVKAVYRPNSFQCFTRTTTNANPFLHKVFVGNTPTGYSYNWNLPLGMTILPTSPGYQLEWSDVNFNFNLNPNPVANVTIANSYGCPTVSYNIPISPNDCSNGFRTNSTIENKKINEIEYVNKVLNTGLRISPVPIQNQMKIYSTKPMFQLSIIYLGNIILQKNINMTTNYSADLSEFKTGVYFIKIKYADGTFETKKIIKL